MNIAPSGPVTHDLRAAQNQNLGAVNPPLSVVMSTYNDGAFLLRSIGSILQQSFDDFEFIIVNDGSTDESRAILDSLQDPRIVVIHQENLGVVSALNRALEEAKGTYIARIDGDDRSAPERLRRQIEFLEKHPDHVLVGTWWRVRDLEGKLLGEYPCPYTDIGVRWKMLLDIPFPHSSMMIRRSALERVSGYDPAFAFAQDYDLVTRLARVGKVGAIPALLTDWQLDHEGGRSVCHYREQRSYVHQISRRELTHLFSARAISDEEVEAMWRIVKQPWAVSKRKAHLGTLALRRVRGAFEEAFSGDEAVRQTTQAFRSYATALLAAQAASRSVLVSRLRAAWRLSPAVVLGRHGWMVLLRLLTNSLQGGES